MLRIEALTWTPVSRRIPTIDDLSLEIPAGQRVLLTGPSGCGKSTVLRALAGLLDPEAGDLQGTMTVPERPGERALLLQQPLHALVAASAGREIAFGPENVALQRPEIQERVTGAFTEAAVDVDSRRDPFTTSGGQQQRLSLAGSLALEPGALLLDEPTSMLDEATAREVRRAILDAADVHRTLVIVDHRAEHWLDEVDRVIVLGERAVIELDAPPSQVVLPRALAAHPAPLSPGAEVLSVTGLDVSRRGRREVLLPGVDLTARSGELLAITGPSGSGKTTLLRVLMGLDRPMAGSVSRPEPPWCALVPQDPEHSFVAATVREELTASPWATDAEVAEQLLHAADLTHLSGSRPHTLSGGEQRRLSIAAALAQSPRLLILDEPTVGLDSERLAGIIRLLDRARSQGTAIVAATHDPRLVERSDREITLPPPEDHTERDPVSTRISAVQHHPRTIADRCSPLSLCLLGILAAIGSFAISSWQIGAMSLALVLLLSPLTVRTVRAALLRLAPVLLSAAGLAWTTALLSNEAPLSAAAWLLGAKEASRITYFVAPGVLALISVDPTALGDALRNRLRAPARPVAAAIASLVRVGHLRQQWERILDARVMRGLGGGRSARTLASATLALLVDMLRGAEQQALAMDARGFAQATHRRPALGSPFGSADVLAIGIGMILLAAPWVLRLLLGG